MRKLSTITAWEWNSLIKRSHFPLFVRGSVQFSPDLMLLCLLLDVSQEGSQDGSGLGQVQDS